MDSETQPTAQFPVLPEIQPAQPQPSADKPKLIAPVWHTILVVALILLNSYGGSLKSPARFVPSNRLFIYGGTFVIQLILVLVIWWGMSRRGYTMRQLIGGRWTVPEDFLIDLGIGIGFWLAALLLVAALKIALGIVDLHHPEESLRQMKQAVGPLIPKSYIELGLFLLLTVFAGLFEEIIFRGYLQKQFGALSRNIFVGVAASAVLFGAAHGYQGLRMMVIIGVYGLLLGLLAVWRKSLRPGMIAHAWTDAVSGVILFFS